jgi:hypothetical protein
MLTYYLDICILSWFSTSFKNWISIVVLNLVYWWWCLQQIESCNGAIEGIEMFINYDTGTIFLYCYSYLDFFYCSLEILFLSWWIYLVLIVGEHRYLKWLITTHIVGYNALEIGLHIYVSKKRKRIEFKSELSYSNRLDIIYRELL